MIVNAEKDDEMQFYIARNEMKFGVVEFVLITGLNFTKGPTDDEKEVMSGSDRLINIYFSRLDNVKIELFQNKFLAYEVLKDAYKVGLCLFVETVLLG
ncbi:hypothetical protein CsatB_009574 [Cannabis sativa]